MLSIGCIENLRCISKPKVPRGNKLYGARMVLTCGHVDVRKMYENESSSHVLLSPEIN